MLQLGARCRPYLDPWTEAFATKCSRFAVDELLLGQLLVGQRAGDRPWRALNPSAGVREGGYLAPALALHVPTNGRMHLGGASNTLCLCKHCPVTHTCLMVLGWPPCGALPILGDDSMRSWELHSPTTLGTCATPPPATQQHERRVLM